MKERLLTLAGALVAFYLVYMLLLPKPAPFEPKISYPTTEDRGRYGLAAARQWLDQAGINTLSQRERYHQLYANPGLPRSGNLLIISLPLRLPSRDWEEQQLLTWLREGNSVLVLAALSDWPEWAQLNASSVTHMLNVLGFAFNSEDLEIPNEEEEQYEKSTSEKIADSLDKLQEEQAEARKLVTTFDHQLTHGIDSVQGDWKKTEGLDWSLQGAEEARSLLVLLKDSETGGAGLWLGRIGEGRMIVSRHADLFGNVSLGQADNAHLLANIVDSSLGQDGYVIFDDMHQGLSALYDPEAFYDDSRLHHTLWFILVLWLVYLLGHTNRFLPVTNKPRQLHLIDHIRAIGNFLSRRLQPAAVAQRMLLHFFNDIRRYHGLPRNGQPVWDKLAGYQQLDAQTLADLQSFHQRAEQQKPVNLIKLDQLIKSIRKQLS